jgi:hypothetical protein
MILFLPELAAFRARTAVPPPAHCFFSLKDLARNQGLEGSVIMCPKEPDGVAIASYSGSKHYMGTGSPTMAGSPIIIRIGSAVLSDWLAVFSGHTNAAFAGSERGRERWLKRTDSFADVGRANRPASALTAP